MNDTILLAMSRENMIKKVKLMIINGSVLDREPININSLSIKHCDLYTYLGSPFVEPLLYFG